MFKNKAFLTIYSISVIVISIILFVFYVYSDKYSFSFGLDLAGGTQITYLADVSDVEESEIKDRIDSLVSVIERRVNVLGVSEPKVYSVSASSFTGLEPLHRLVVELPGVTDIDEATKAIGETPFLEFKIFDSEVEDFVDTSLEGLHVKSSDVQFLQGYGGALTNEPIVLINFNSEGGRLFADLTRNNVGNLMGIFLDGTLISSPVIREAILGGTTQIQGSFTLESAKDLSSNLNLGALPLPIELSETRIVNPSLGIETISDSAYAGLIALLLIILFFIFIYRFVGVVAVVTLLMYCVFMLSIFKFIPIVLTAAGLAGFVMSLGFAVDANVLIFERIREELRDGKGRVEAIENGFSRAWLSIRDANITSVIISLLLFWFGTSIIKGFAFTFIIGILLSMVSAYFITRLLLRLTSGAFNKKMKKLYIR